MATGVAASPSWSFITTGNLEEPLVLTNASGAVTSATTRDPWGNVITLAGTDATSMGFPGQWKNLAAGLYQNWNRDYDPALGRYSEADPIGLAGGSNLYAYVGGNPLNAIDPEGLHAASPAEVGTIAFRWWLERQRNPVRSTPWGRIWGIGEAIGVTAAVGVYLYRQNCNDDGRGGFNSAGGGGDSGDRCGQEWQEAYRICRAELSKPNPSLGITGGQRNLQSCARGLVSEECGGNKLTRYFDPYTRRPLGPKGRRSRR